MAFRAPLLAAVLLANASLANAAGCTFQSNNSAIMQVAAFVAVPANQGCFVACPDICQGLMYLFGTYLSFSPTGEKTNEAMAALQAATCTANIRPLVDCSQTKDNLPLCKGVLGFAAPFGTPQDAAATAKYCGDPTPLQANGAWPLAAGAVTVVTLSAVVAGVVA